jgi:hypothetical protein
MASVIRGESDHPLCGEIQNESGNFGPDNVGR